MVNFQLKQNHVKNESIRIDPNRKKGSLVAKVYRFQDNDTKQHVLFIPSLQITSYGENLEKAKEMLRGALTEYMKMLTSFSHEKIAKELLGLGWRHVPFAKKQYSKAFVDTNGELQNLNAFENKVEELTLTA